MTVLVDFNFDDKHTMEYYGIVNPSEKLIHQFSGNKLIISAENSVAVAFGVKFENFAIAREATVTLKSAKGDVLVMGFNSHDFVVNSPEPKDVVNKVLIRNNEGSRGDLIFVLLPNKEGNSYFEFTGYKLKYDF